MQKKVLLIFSIIFIFFWIKSWLSIDPDFGWHLKTGNLILMGQFPKVDPFSYTMPSFPFVDHAWIVSLFFGFFYPFIDQIGLSFIVSFFVVLTLWISFPNKKGYLLPVVLASSVLLSFIGLRSQVFTWLMLSILLRVILDIKLWKRLKYFSPLFFLFWANLHGGFVSGLLVMALIFVLRVIKHKKIILADVIILILSLFATLINPYGLNLWKEEVLIMFNGLLRESICEWLPTILITDISMIVFFPLFISLILFARKRFSLERLSLFIAFLFQAIFSARHVPLFIIVSLPMVEKAIDSIFEKASKIKYAQERLKKAYKLMFIVSILLLCFQFYSLTFANFSLDNDKFYPEKAIVFLKSNLPKGEIFSIYNWGGYLVWKLPEKKVFVDGRMPVWEREIFPENEIGSAFRDSTKILLGEMDYKLTFSKFNIDTVLLSVEKKRKGFDLLDKAPSFSFNKKLEDDGWNKIYFDDVSIIFQKPLN